MHKNAANVRTATARGYLLLSFAPGSFASPFSIKEFKD
jgi:hypothetical protein